LRSRERERGGREEKRESEDKKKKKKAARNGDLKRSARFGAAEAKKLMVEIFSEELKVVREGHEDISEEMLAAISTAIIRGNEAYPEPDEEKDDNDNVIVV